MSGEEAPNPAAIVADALADSDRTYADGQGDPEGAHGAEDYAYEQALRAIASGYPDPRGLATVCVEHMDATEGRVRWYA